MYMEYNDCQICGAEKSVPPVKRIQVCHTCKSKHRIFTHRDLSNFRKVEAMVSFVALTQGYDPKEIIEYSSPTNLFAFKRILASLIKAGKIEGNVEMVEALERYEKNGGR